MVLGIAGVVMWPLGLLVGPIALFLGISARRDLVRRPGTGGGGLAIAGIVLGSIGCLLGLLGIAVILTLFTAIGTIEELTQAPEMAFDVDSSGDGGTLTVTDLSRPLGWSDLQLGGTASCTLPEGDVDVGDEIVCWTDGDVVLIHRVSDEEVFAAPV